MSGKKGPAVTPSCATGTDCLKQVLCHPTAYELDSQQECYKSQVASNTTMGKAKYKRKSAEMKHKIEQNNRACNEQEKVQVFEKTEDTEMEIDGHNRER